MSQTTQVAPMLRLPTELHLHIFSHLDPVFSTCLGLTCKPLYLLHREVHRKISLFAESQVQFATCTFTHRPPISLHYLLITWAKPLVFCFLGYGKLVTSWRRVEKVIEGLKMMGLPRHRGEERWLKVWQRVLREDVDWNAGRDIQVGSQLWDMSAGLSYHLRGLGL